MSTKHLTLMKNPSKIIYNIIYYSTTASQNDTNPLTLEIS